MQLLHIQLADNLAFTVTGNDTPKEGPGTSTGKTGQTGSRSSAVEVIDDCRPDCT